MENDWSSRFGKNLFGIRCDGSTQGIQRIVRYCTRVGLGFVQRSSVCIFSRRGNTVKILTWDRGGFVVWHKRLEWGRYKIPKVASGESRVQLDAGQLSMLLDGVDIGKVRRQKCWEPEKSQPAQAVM